MKKIILFFMALLLSWGSFRAQEQLDQYNTPSTAYKANIQVGYNVRFTFTAGVTGTLSKITLKVGGGTAEGIPYTIKLYATSQGLPTSEIATSTVSNTEPINTVEKDLVFSTPPSVIAGTQYAVLLPGWYTDMSTDTYSDGSSVYYSLSNPYDPSTGAWHNNTYYDYYFKTYVIPAPSPLAISTQPSTTSQNVTVGDTATSLTVAASGGTSPYTYQWYSNSSNSNTGGTAISDATSATYTPPTTTTSSKYYYAVVTDSATPTSASVTSNVSGNIVVSPPSLSIATQPSNSAQNISVGNSATPLSITATGGTSPYTYQWYSNTTNSNSGGNAISGATSSTFTPTSSGTLYYYVVVTDSASPSASVTSNVSGKINIAQRTAVAGSVGINTTLPIATLNVQGKGNTSATRNLRLENSDGTNLLTILDDGSVSGTAVPNLGGGGGSGSYTLPTASATTLGGVKIGSGINIDANGVISSSGGSTYTLPAATSSTLGGVKVGSGISVDANGVISTNAVPSGGTNGQVLSTNGTTASWTTPTGDNLGNHTATQDLNMSNKNIASATNITGSGIGSFGSIGAGTTTPNSSAIVEMASTTKGVLIPRMTAAQKALIGSPATGLLVYQTDGTAGFYYFTGSVWQYLTTVIPTVTSGTNGAVLSNNGTSNLWNTNLLVNGPNSIIGSIGAAGVQINSAGGDGLNLRTGTGNNSITVAKDGAPSNGNVYLDMGYVNGSNNFVRVGSIAAGSSSTVTYNTSSDKRLKNDLGIYANAVNVLNNIKIHNYSWKDSGIKETGVFAQELYKVYPNAVLKGDDNETTVSKRWMVDYSKLVPVLVAAGQELSKENETLKAENQKLNKRLDELEATVKLLTEKK